MWETEHLPCPCLYFRQRKTERKQSKTGQKKTERKKTEQNRAKNGFQQFDGAVSCSRVGRRMAMHSLQPREAEQPSAIGSNLLLPFAATGSPCSLPLDLPLSPSSWFLLLLRLLLFLFIFWWWWRWWWLFLHPQLQQRALLSFPFRLILSLIGIRAQ